MSTKRIVTLLSLIAAESTLLLPVGSAALFHRSNPSVGQKEAQKTPAKSEKETPDAKDAQAQFDLAFKEERKGDLSAAINGYKKTVNRFSRTPIAPIAQFRIGQLYEKQNELLPAFHAYEKLVKDYPRSPDFEKALEGEFRIGTAYLEGARKKVLGLPTLPSMDTAVSIFSSILKNAPYSKYTPLAAFNIGTAKEKQGQLKDAINAYQVVIDKYPLDPVAADALYQIGFVWLTISRSGSYDRIATTHARESFEDFLMAYPHNEKAAQAHENLESLNVTQTDGTLRIAQYYDRQNKYRAAVIYYNEVLKQNPDSADGGVAKKRLGAIRARYGSKAIDGIINPTGNVTTTAVDNRLQSQTDTSERTDYNGPEMGTSSSLGTYPQSGNAPFTPMNLPPPIPDNEEPSLPTSENPPTTDAEAAPASP